MGERAVIAGRTSGDDLAVARALLNQAGTLAVQRDPDLKRVLEEALELFLREESEEHKQGVGWYWLLVADMCDAGLLQGDVDTEIEAAEHAIDALTPIRNWQGISRSHQALERAYAKKGCPKAAERAGKAARHAEAKARQEKR